MKYIRYQYVVSKVFDDTVEDEDVIRKIFGAIKENELDCSIILNDGVKFSRVRIEITSDSGFTFIMVGTNSSLRKSAKYVDVSCLEITTNSNDLFRNKPNVSRWLLLDSSECDE